MTGKVVVAMVLLGMFQCLVPIPGACVDMRVALVAARDKKSDLVKEMEHKEVLARKEAAQSREKITSDKSALTEAIRKIKNENRALKKESELLAGDIAALAEMEKVLKENIARIDAVARELSGFVGTFARDLTVLVAESPQSALAPGRESALESLLQKDQTPGMAHIRSMADLLLDEITRAGEVRIENGAFVDRTGKESTAEILMLGNFTAAYREGGETGFLLYSEQSRRMFALSKLPKRGVAKKLSAYMDGSLDAVPMDITRGAALRQLTHHRSLAEQIKGGGPIIWPILGIFIIATLIILERSVFLLRKRTDAEKMMSTVRGHICRGKWEDAAAFCEKYAKKPLARVLSAGMEFRQMGREDMENALQEAILREIPALERFLSTLGMLAAIAPLLGLLGTVTGMINTFHVITYQGTSDPRMMSGGISEALVTTMLGLSVAIPVMVAHTVLTRRVDGVIGGMEEKAVSLVNTIFKARNGK